MKKTKCHRWGTQVIGDHINGDEKAPTPITPSYVLPTAQKVKAVPGHQPLDVGGLAGQYAVQINQAVVANKKQNKRSFLK